MSIMGEFSRIKFTYTQTKFTQDSYLIINSNHKDIWTEDIWVGGSYIQTIHILHTGDTESLNVCG